MLPRPARWTIPPLLFLALVITGYIPTAEAAHQDILLTKLANPTSLPPATGADTAWNPDGTLLAVATTASPYIIVYQRSGTTLTKLSDPAALPTGVGRSVAWSPDGSYLAVGHNTDPFLTVYSVSGSTLTKLDDPATKPSEKCYSVAWSPDGAYLGCAIQGGATTLALYARSGSTLTKLSDPSTMPAGSSRGVQWSPDGSMLAVGHESTPYVSIYTQSGTTFTKLADPATLPAGTSAEVSWSPDGAMLSISGAVTSPYLTTYSVSGTTFTKISDPATAPAGVSFGLRWSPDSTYLSVGHATSPYMTVYERTGTTLAKVSNPATLPAGQGFGSDWTADGSYLAIGHDTTPFITVYAVRNPPLFTYLPGAAASSTGAGIGLGWTSEGDLFAHAHGNSPYVTIYSVSGETYTKLPDPAVLPAGSSSMLAWSPDDDYLAVSSESATPSFTVYYRDDGTNTFTKLANPASATASVNHVCWNNDGSLLGVTHSASPYVTIYQKTGSGADAILTKLSSPASLPTAIAVSCAFSPDGTMLVVGYNASPYVKLYSVSGTTFTAISDPATAPTGLVRGIGWRSDGAYVGMAHSTSPFVSFYSVSGQTLTKVADPATLPDGTGGGVAWSPNGAYVTVAHDTTQFATIYEQSGSTFTKLADPANLPTTTSNGVAWSPSGSYMALNQGSSPWIRIYRVDPAQPADPPTPGSLAATAGDRQVALTWDASTGADHYSVFRSTSSLASTLPLNTTGYTFVGTTTSTSYTDTGRTPGTAVYYRVQAVDDAGGESAASAEVSVTPYEIPVDVTIISNTTTGPSVGWLQTTDPRTTGYNVYRNGTLLTTINDPATPSHLDTTVSPNTDYSYTVSAVGTGFTETPQSSAVLGHMAFQPTANVVGLTVTNQSGAIRLEWAQTSDTNANGYQVWRNGTPIANVTPTTQLVWTDTNVTTSTVYNYSMALTSPDSNEIIGPVSTNKSGMLAVAAPHNFAIVNSTSSVALDWDTSLDANVTSYEVLRNGTLLVSGLTTTSWADTNVTPGVTYSYTLKARVDGELASSPTSAQPGHIVSIPSTPGNLAAEPTAGVVRLTWTSNHEADLGGYKIYRSTSSNTPIGAGSLIGSVTTTTVFDASGAAGAVYYYRVTSFNTVGDESGATPDAVATYPSSSGGGGGAIVVPIDDGGVDVEQVEGAGAAGGFAAVGAAIGGALESAGIHVPDTSISEFEWWQYVLLFLGLALLLAALPFSKLLFPKNVQSTIGAMPALAVLAGVLLWTIVYFSA